MARPEYRLTPRAERDLEEIWRFTSTRWSAEHAETYVTALLEAMDALAQEPALGRPVDDIRPGYRRQNAGTHVVFYKATKYGIEVVRILHQRMDFGSHFGSG